MVKKEKINWSRDAKLQMDSQILKQRELQLKANEMANQQKMKYNWDKP